MEEKRNWRRLYILLSIGFFLYTIFHVIFFKFLSGLSVEGLIGVSIIFLFCLIYRFGGVFIDRYLLSISRNVWLYYVNLISLTYLVKQLFIKTIDSAKRLMVFQFISNHLVFSEIEKVFNELNSLLLSKYLLNIILSELFFKRLVIKNLTEKNVISFEVIIFINKFLNYNAFMLNNTLGWFTK